MGVDRRLDKVHALAVGVNGHPGQEQHKGGGGADHNGVDEHGQHLHQALLHRMGHISGSGGVGGGAHTGLVGVEAPLDALHDAGGSDPGKHGLGIEGLGEDQGDHVGHLADVLNGDKEAQSDIDGGHHRHDAGGDGTDAAHAAKDTHTGEDGQHRAHHHGPDAVGVVGQIILEGGTGVIGLEGIEAVGKTGNEQHGEHHAEEPAAKRLLDIVGRAAYPVLPVLLLVALGQGALNKGGGRTDEGQQPHPEHRAVAADEGGGDDGVGHTGDVAGTHPGGGGDHQGLEGRDILAVLLLLPQHTDGLREQAELDALGADGEVEPREDKQGNQNIGVEEVACVAQKASKKRHRVVVPFSYLLRRFCACSVGFKHQAFYSLSETGGNFTLVPQPPRTPRS